MLQPVLRLASLRLAFGIAAVAVIHGAVLSDARAATERTTERPPMQTKVIYGDDNRLDPFQLDASDQLFLSSQATALIVDKSALKRNEKDDGSKLDHTTYGADRELCTGEPFFEQPVAGWCSAFLIGPRTMVTAGHCIPDQ